MHLLLVLLLCPLLADAGSLVDRVAQRNADNPYAHFSVDAVDPLNKGGCYKQPDLENLDDAAGASLLFTDAELKAAALRPSIDWRKHGAVGPVQQQHPFGTCWAFSMIAVTEAINVIQGKNAYQKLSEQMVISCVPPTACGDNSDVLWSWAFHNTGGRYQTEQMYPYNRTCNFFREQQMAPDGTPDGYPGKCDLPGPPPYAPCPPCPGITRKDGTPACKLPSGSATRMSATPFSTASVQGWAFIGPHGLNKKGQDSASGVAKLQAGAPNDVTRMVAALQKYGPAQIGIDASCLEGYTSGIITNCTSRNVDHAVAIVGAGTDAASGVDYWIVRNSWNATFGEDGYFRVQRDTAQMGIFGGYFGCYNKHCMVDP